MWENRCRGTGISCKAAASCLVTLALEQVWQSFTHCVTSLLIQDHITLWPIILLVAFARGAPCCERRQTPGGGVLVVSLGAGGGPLCRITLGWCRRG